MVHLSSSFFLFFTLKSMLSIRCIGSGRLLPSESAASQYDGDTESCLLRYWESCMCLSEWNRIASGVPYCSPGSFPRMRVPCISAGWNGIGLWDVPDCPLKGWELCVSQGTIAFHSQGKTHAFMTSRGNDLDVLEVEWGVGIHKNYSFLIIEIITLHNIVLETKINRQLLQPVY